MVINVQFEKLLRVKNMWTVSVGLSAIFVFVGVEFEDIKYIPYFSTYLTNNDLNYLDDIPNKDLQHVWPDNDRRVFELQSDFGCQLRFGIRHFGHNGRKLNKDQHGNQS